MIEISVPDKNAAEIIELVRELRNAGLVQGRDFDFKYNAQKFDYMSGAVLVERHTIFTFYVEKQATFFLLKYGS